MSLRLWIPSLAVVVLGAAPLAAQQIVIDDFETAQATLTLTGTGMLNSFQDGAVILQTERNLKISGSGFGGGTSLDEDVSSGALNVTRTASITTSNAEVWWDGDNSTPTFNPTGLGGVNLTAGGQNRFTITGGTSAGNAAQQLRLTVWTNPTNNSTATFSLPPGGGTVDLLYSSFAVNLGAGATFSNVGAISLDMISTSAALWIYSIQDFRTTPVELTSFSVE